MKVFSAVTTMKLVSLISLILQMMPPLVTTSSLIWRFAIISWSFCCCFFLRSENQEVEDEKNQDNRREPEKSESILLTSLKEKKIIHFGYLMFAS